MKSLNPNPAHMLRSLLLAALLTGPPSYAAVGGEAAAGPGPLEPRGVWTGLELNVPVQIVVPPDDSGRLFLVQQRGQIQILPADRGATDIRTVLDLSDRELEAHKFEEGLLALLFHPGFKENGRLFTYHTEQNPKRSILTEWRVDASDPDRIDPASERVLLEIPQPFWNHNSGSMLFGADGLLYLAVGDGGFRGDPMNHSQNLFSLLGKVLRIDVDSTYGSLAYGIPEDNPFYGKEGHRWEVYAYGLRNTWGLFFDDDQDLWLADVGQDLWEEINLIKPGGNYGWNFREGARAYPGRSSDPPAELELIDPIHEYTRLDGLSITGGVIYQGQRRPDLVGRCIYGDWATGRIWALDYDKQGGAVISNEVIFEAGADDRGRGAIQPTAFCFDENGEILILCWRGAIYELR